MSREYAENRIQEALKLSKGNAVKARQKIMAWCFEDPKLLQALSQPHLTGIVAHAVNRVIHKQDSEPQEAPEKPAHLDMSPESFGQEILHALSSGNTAMFGEEASAPPVGRKAASRSHVDAIHKLSRKGKDIK